MPIYEYECKKCGKCISERKIVMPLQAPWTDIGRLQQDISDLQRRLGNKVESYEVGNINRKLHDLANTVAHIQSQVNEILNKIHALESKV